MFQFTSRQKCSKRSMFFSYEKDPNISSKVSEQISAMAPTVTRFCKNVIYIKHNAVSCSFTCSIFKVFCNKQHKNQSRAKYYNENITTKINITKYY